MVIPLKFFVLVGVMACLVLAAWIALFHYQIGPYRPLRERATVNFPSTAMDEVERASFLDGNFMIADKMRALPSAIIAVYTELDGKRLTMADPGRQFEAGDVIYDASIPRKRLIFAGIQNQKCFLHFEQGGRGHSFLLVFFRLGSANGTKPVWVSYCNRPATDFADLRGMIRDGRCH
jgi:hypothetical protein